MKYLVLLGMLALAAILTTSAHAQSAVTRYATPAIAPDSWMIEAWTGDNRPYRQSRTETDKVSSNPSSLDSIAKRLESDVEKNPSDPKREYQWAYATYKSAIVSNPRDENKLILSRDALQRANPPHSYDYTRLRFLIEATLFVGPQYNNFIAVGKRLMQRDPNDVEVKYQMVKILGDSPRLTDQNMAVAYAESMVHQHPERGNYHANLAGAFLSRWLLFRNHSDAENAVAEYQRYLTIAPPDASFRSQAEHMIKLIRERE